MKYSLAAVLLATSAIMAQAGPIRDACLSSSRAGGDRALCSCIQQAADKTLTKRDQRLAASLFRDPDSAQEIRRSDRRAHEVFWERYRSFGEVAEAVCS
ncbi:MAG: hypothetical protein KJO15_17385 [Alphaproteobacteria bacterium]|nr:hypothetical protein [Alphaproteobacteria bacterium]